MSTPVNISSVIKEVVAATSVKMLAELQAVDPLITGIHFEFGHHNDIRERLTAKSKTAKTAMYPLIALFEDFRVKRGKLGTSGIADMKIIILHFSKNTYTRQQREDLVFTPILFPIYNEFLRQLKINGKFMIYDETLIQHDMIKRPHWGDPALYENTSYLFGEILDGIELNNLELTTFLSNCLAA